MSKRPEFLVGRIILLLAFALEFMFWRILVSHKSRVLFGSIAGLVGLIATVHLRWPPIYLSTAFFILTLLLNPSRYLLNIAERRMGFWSRYEFGLATSETYRLARLREQWWRKPKGTAG